MHNIFLETERLYLRQMTAADFKDLSLLLQNPAVMYAWERSFSDADVFEWIHKNINRYKENSLGYFLVYDKKTDEIIGQAALMPDAIDGKTYYEIGYMLKPEAWHKGYARECAKYLATHAFNSLGINEVIFEIRPNNLPSLKVAEKLGAKLCGSFDKKVKNRTMKHLIYKLKQID